MSKNIVICSDRTGNTFDGYIANVARLVQHLALDRPDRQVVRYDQGVGTTRRESEFAPLAEAQGLQYLPAPTAGRVPPIAWVNRARGLGFGHGPKENVGQLYRELAQLCDDPDDRVFLFTFSHGAFTVRTLAGLLHRCDLPNPGGTSGADERFEQAFPVRRRAGCACRSRPDRVGFVVAARLMRRHAVTGSGHAADMHPQGHAAAGPVATQPSRSLSTGAEPPIGCYSRVPVEIHQADPHAAEVAKRLIALIAASWPGAVAEHVGSSAVPGLAGKGIIDLLLPADPADLACVTQALFELGFQLQDPQAFPPTRPMLWGVLRHRSNDYRVHVHVVPNSSPEVGAMRGFRDALRADPELRHGYAALKRAIVAGGPVDPVIFTKAKHGWIAAALGQLGLPSGRHLYQDDPAGTAPAIGC